MDTAFLNNKIGRYQIQERIGKGGMAQVYRARDTNLDRMVAVKVLHEHLSDDPTFKERFEREAKFVGGFNHPNIVQVYDFDSFERDGQRVYYMVMPYIPGQTLRDLLEDLTARDQMMPPEQAFQIAVNLADALYYAHQRGMVHRDVKPGNILFDERGQAVLTDFGIARLVASSNLTQEGLTVGTPTYMSPEQISGEMVDARSDIYALGVIVYEMLAGHTPFPDDGSVSILLKTLNEPVPPLSDIITLPHPAIDAVVLKALSKDPADRYQTALDFANDLKSAFKGDRVTAAFPAVAPSNTQKRTTSPEQTTTRTIQLMTQQIQTAARSPSGILAIGLSIIIFLLAIAVFRPTTTPPDTNNNSVTDESSMTDDNTSMTGPVDALYFISTFSADDEYGFGWPQSSEGPLIREMTDDGYYRLVNNRNQFAMPTIFEPLYKYQDGTITLKATLEAGSAAASGYGIVFRYMNGSNYYVFTVDGVGRYAIWSRRDGRWLELRQLAEEWTENEAVNRVGEINSLTLDFMGDTFIGYVNGEKVVEIKDSTFTEPGAVGIYVASTPASNTSVLVDEFSVMDIAFSMTASMTDATDEP